MTNVTFEEKIAYEIGVKLAHEAYMEKEASWQAAKTLMGGLKGVATGQGTSISKAFQQGAKQVEGAGATNFRGVMGEVGQGLAAPWKNMYQTFGARQGVKSINAANAEHAAARKTYEAAMKGTDEAAQRAAKATLEAAGKNIGKVGDRYGAGYGATEKIRALTDTAQRGYIPRNAAGQVDYGQLGTMAAGAGLAGTGAYMAGNAAFGGGNNTYVNNPQVAPHQYYMNQLSSYFGS